MKYKSNLMEFYSETIAVKHSFKTKRDKAPTKGAAGKLIEG